MGQEWRTRSVADRGARAMASNIIATSLEQMRVRLPRMQL